MNATLWAACDDGDKTTFTRVSVEGGGAVDNDADVTTVTDGFAETTTDGGDAALDADGGEGGPAPPTTLATGSGEHPTPAIGYGDHTCVIAGNDRGVYCWGANDHGQLGVGNALDTTTATKITTDETGLLFIQVDEISAAAWHTCARKGDVLFCWGQRLTGAQAEPPADPNADRLKPRAIGNLAVKAMAAGGPHTCALKTNGKFTCFGHSYFNELGRARAGDPACTAPFFHSYVGVVEHTCSGDLLEAAANMMHAEDVVAGEIHSCSLADASVYCWGNNTVGQLGVPGAATGELNAQQVVTNAANLTPIDQVSAIAAGGGKHTCALRAGKVLCWGANGSGQLGVDPATTAQRANAAEVPGITAATAIGVADGVSCAVGAGGSVWCWGAAESGQLGDAGVAVDGGIASFTPQQIKGPLGAGNLTGVVSIAPGRRHVCARKSDDTVWCWGKNDRGQLGDSTKVDSVYPVKVTGLP